MSSSFLKRAALVALLATPAAWAQQGYFIPSAEISVESDTNRELTTDSSLEESSEVYRAALEALMGRAGPRSQLELKPRVVFQEFPDREGANPVEYFLDLRHDYRTLKGKWSLAGRYEQQDTINAEFDPTSVVDDGDPNTPPPPIDDSSGIVLVGETRRAYSITPRFQYSFSEKMSFDARLRYQRVDYDTNSLNPQVGYDSPYLELNLVRKVAPLTSFSFGPYASHYEADDDALTAGASLETDTYGLRLGLDHDWSEVSSVSISLRGEHNDTTCQCITPIISGTSTDWGLEISGVRRSQVGNLRYGVGRFLTPSTLGNRRQSDQIQLQYQRALSEKMGFNAAVRMSRDQAIGPNAIDNDRDRIRVELGLNRFLTPTWYVAGGYRYLWQDLAIIDDSAANHSVFLSIGVKGRDPRRANR